MSRKVAKKKRPGRKPTRRGRAVSRAGGAGKTRRRHIGGALLRWGVTAAIWGVLVVGATVAYYAYDLPNINQLDQKVRRPLVTVLAADGSRVASYGDRYGTPTVVADLPPYLIQAVLATEDRRFYEHFGLDLRGLARAALVDIRAGRIIQGGSTLTQQLAKNLFLTPARSIGRKIREAILAIKLERRFTKNQILTIYLNRVYLGAGTWGVDAAAQRYFGKPATKLTRYEAAMIAGLLKAPSRYNPARHPNLARRRTVLVLNSMVEAGYISRAKAQAVAKRGARGIARVAESSAQRYFADWVLDRVRARVGYVAGDLTVRTTLVPREQRLAQTRSRALLDAARRAKVGQVALVALAPDGAVRAMVGGRDYRKSQFNRAARALRQPGSAFKPFVYLAALESGFTPASRFRDAPVTVDGWTPRNYGRRYYGSVTLKDAMARSLNTVAVRVSERVGRRKVIAAARRLGISSPLLPHPSIALGASEVTLLELTAAYDSFANGGFGVVPYGIVEIRAGNGKVLYRHARRRRVRVVSAHNVRAMDDILGAVISEGTGKRARIGRPAAGKTGTSQDFRDAWFIGYTPGLVTGVWVGNDDGAPMKRVTGGGLPARIWRSFMVGALKGRPVRAFPTAAIVRARPPVFRLNDDPSRPERAFAR